MKYFDIVNSSIIRTIEHQQIAFWEKKNR